MTGKKTLALANLQSATHCHKLAVYSSNYFITFRRIVQLFDRAYLAEFQLDLVVLQGLADL